MNPFSKCFLISLVVPCFARFASGAEIHGAVMDNNIQAVQSMLEADSSLIHAVDEHGNTPLHLACRKGWLEIARLLVDKGADLNPKNGMKFTPIRLAVYNQEYEMVELMLAYGASTDDIHPSFGDLINHAFVAACQKNKGPETVQAFVAHGIKFDPNHLDALGMSRLDWAAHFGNLEMIRFALEQGAEVNKVSERLGRTPLIGSILNGHADLVSLLLSHGADVTIPDSEGNTPIRFAVEQGRTDIVNMLLSHGASIIYRDGHYGRSLLHLAAIRGYGDMAKLLVENGAEINAEDYDGKTPLYYAGLHGNSTAGDYLVERGAVVPVDLQKNYGVSKWLGKALKGNESVIWYLNHRGWTLKTKSRFFVFDAEEFGVTRPDNPCLANGFLTPKELQNQDILAMYSCYHGNPGEPAYIHILADSVENIAFVHLIDDNWRGSPNTAYLKDKADTVIAGIRMHAFNPAGYMPMLAYLYDIDDLTVFYQAFGTDDYDKLKDDYAFLSQFADTVDIAFLPLPEPGTEEESDLRYFLERFPTRAVFLSDPGRREYLFASAAAKVAEWGHKTEVFCAENPGDCFVLSASD